MSGWSFEYALENNALRSKVRESMEVKRLRAAADVGPFTDALHIACGCGKATELIRRHFDARRWSAIDREEGLIAAARERYAGEPVSFSVQDVRSLDFPDSSFDAVFDLADLHNHANWERGLSEMRRVLRPGGFLLLEEISRESFERGAGRLFKALTEHPYDSMLTVESLRAGAAREGFEVQSFRTHNPLGLFLYHLMIARKA
jgi:ubiquinone/menaquinone biosynthesis C-methylase UbiE